MIYNNHDFLAAPILAIQKHLLHLNHPLQEEKRMKYGEGRRVFKMSPLHHHFQ